MIGYKAFDKDLRCRGFQFEVGKTYGTGAAKDGLKLCSDTVFHFCREIHKIDDESDYSVMEDRVCEIIATGDIITDGNDNKYGTDEIMILREIPREELEKIARANSGSWNRGNHNSGSRNSGDRNSGNWNSGDWNSGSRNIGDWNSGNCNIGNCNSGSWNSGDWNSGSRNIGSWNSGDRNSGSRNSGSWNSGDRNSGIFNSDEPPLRIFNAFTDKRIDEIDIPGFLFFDLSAWVTSDMATEKEREAHKKEIDIAGGFLKCLGYKEAFRMAWDGADLREHEKLLELPNWNNRIFMEISGIDAEAEIEKERKKQAAQGI